MKEHKKRTPLLLKIRNMLLIRKLIAVYAIVCILLIGGSIFYYYSSSRALAKEEDLLANTLTQQAMDNIEQGLTATIRSIFDNYNTSVLLSQSLTGYTAGSNYYLYVNEIHTALGDFLASRGVIRWVAAADLNGELFHNARTGVSIPYDCADAFEEDKRLCIEAAAGVTWRVLEDGTINLSRMIFNLSNMQYTGYIIANVRAGAFAASSSALDQLSGVSLVVYDSFGAPMLYYGMDDKTRDAFKSIAVGDQELAMPGGSVCHLTWERIGDSRLAVCRVVNLGSAPMELSNLSRAFVVICLSTLLLVTAAIFVVFREVRINISAVKGGIEAVSKGDFSFRVQPAALDEIGQIGLAVNGMADKICALMERVERETDLRHKTEYLRLESQYSALQAQINPHLMFNALESINSLAKLHGDEQIGVATRNIAKLLRSNLERTGVVCPLYSEIGYIIDYVNVYREIYPDTLELKLTLERDLDELPVPTFILQPIVENAIVHGICPKVSHGTITIRTELCGDKLHIAVTDDGIGFLPGNASLDEEPKTSDQRHIGLWNVRERLRFLYGDAGSLIVQSAPDCGTTVELYLPI